MNCTEASVSACRVANELITDDRRRVLDCVRLAACNPYTCQWASLYLWKWTKNGSKSGHHITLDNDVSRNDLVLDSLKRRSAKRRGMIVAIHSFITCSWKLNNFHFKFICRFNQEGYRGTYVLPVQYKAC